MDRDPLDLGFFTPRALVDNRRDTKGDTSHRFGWPKKKRHFYSLKAKWDGFQIDCGDPDAIAEAYDFPPGKPCTILATDWGFDAAYEKQAALSACKASLIGKTSAVFTVCLRSRDTVWILLRLTK